MIPDVHVTTDVGDIDFVSDAAPADVPTLARGECVVCIPCGGDLSSLAESLRSVLRHTPTSVPILVAEWGAYDSRVKDALDAVAQSDRLRLRVIGVGAQAQNTAAPILNHAFAISKPADVIMIQPDCVVNDGWIKGLQDAAYSDTTVATACPLTNRGRLISIPLDRRPVTTLPQEWTVEEAAAAITARSTRLHPRIPLASGQCLYVKRSALDLVGGFTPRLSQADGAIEFTMRCLKRGLSQVVADDVFVVQSGASAAENAPQIDTRLRRDRALWEQRLALPAIMADLEHEEESPVGRAVNMARRTLTGLSVTIDGMCLGHAITGTQVLVLELVTALAQVGSVKLEVVVPHSIGDVARRRLHALEGVRLTHYDEILGRSKKADVVHRPFQLQRLEEVHALARLGQRMVITQQDLIAYRNPTYFATPQRWLRYREATRQGLNAADLVIFLTEHGARDAASEGLVDGDRAKVVHNASDHTAQSGSAVPPAPMRELRGRDYLLCVGADFHHKNRVFALDLLRHLRTQEGWPGVLVLAGPKVAEGSSAEEEAAFLLRHPELEGSVIRVGYMTDGEKSWMYQQARAFVYPTTYEGFGQIPFEAAVAGVPCIFAAQSALASVLPKELATIVPWSAAETAREAAPLLNDEAVRRRHVTLLRAETERFAWGITAKTMAETYWDVMARPPRRLPGAVGYSSPIRNLAYRTAVSAARKPTVAKGAVTALLAARRARAAALQMIASVRGHDET